MNEDKLWSGSELELLVILLEQEGFTWKDIVEHVAEDGEAGRGCTECQKLLYDTKNFRYINERRFALSRSEWAERPTGFITDDEADINKQEYYARNPIRNLPPF